jgi:hypothetical protein
LAWGGAVEGALRRGGAALATRGLRESEVRKDWKGKGGVGWGPAGRFERTYRVPEVGTILQGGLQGFDGLLVRDFARDGKILDTC